jgi:ABC-2 type transport system permease protein
MFPEDREVLYKSRWKNIPELEEKVTDENVTIVIDLNSFNVVFPLAVTETFGFDISFFGTTTGPVDHLLIKIFLYFDESYPPTNIFDQISPLLNGTLRGPIDLNVLVFKGTGPQGDNDWRTWEFKLNYQPLVNDTLGNGFSEDRGNGLPVDINEFGELIKPRLGFYLRAFSDNKSTEKNWSFTYEEVWLEFDENILTDFGVVSKDTKEVSAVEDGYEVFFNAATPIYFILIIPLITILYSISVIREDIENHTMVYLITRPVSRTEILFFKYKGFIISAWIPLTISLSLSFFITASNEGSIFLHIDYLGTILLIMTLMVFAYGALFFIFALITSYPTVLSLLYVFFIETMIYQQSNVINRFSIMFHIQSIADGMLGDIANVELYQLTTVTDSLIILIGVIIVFLVIAIYIFNNRDFT